jgi:hypothetical protein
MQFSGLVPDIGPNLVESWPNKERRKLSRSSQSVRRLSWRLLDSCFCLSGCLIAASPVVTLAAGVGRSERRAANLCPPAFRFSTSQPPNARLRQIATLPRQHAATPTRRHARRYCLSASRRAPAAARRPPRRLVWEQRVRGPCGQPARVCGQPPPTSAGQRQAAEDEKRTC